jgi:hypothetical protein
VLRDAEKAMRKHVGTVVAGTASVLWFALCGAPARAQSVSAAFDYAMPERFSIPAILDDGAAPGAGEVYTAAAIAPVSWTVDFDACASTGPIVAYAWRIDGQLVDSLSSCSGFSHEFPAEGPYDVSLEVFDSGGGSDSRTLQVVVEDLLIVALGDSYGSGEGVPDVPVPQSQIDLALAKQTALDSALAARDAAVQSYLAALSQYQATVAQLNAALSAQTAYLNARDARDAACPLPVLACTQATAALVTATANFVTALANIGLSNLDVVETTSIQTAIANLRAIATAARDLAQDTRDAAEAALQAAQGEVDAALAALAPVWQNQRCHRSSKSWQVETAAKLAEDPHTSVTLIHLACSGATIQVGLLGEYGGIVPVGNELLAPQVARAAQLVCGGACDASSRRVDTVLVSVGGNDANFAKVIGACVLGEPCYDNPIVDTAAQAAFELQCRAGGLVFGDLCLGPFEPTQALYDAGLDASTIFFDGLQEPATCGDPNVTLDGCNGLDDLPANYAKLHTALAEAFDPGTASRVVLSAYPQITFDENGDRCGWSALDDAATRMRNLAGFSTAEMEWAGDVVSAALRSTMSGVANGFGWTFVDGHVSAFERHGYCSQTNWIVRAQESPLIEASPFGAVHPNAPGQHAYAEAVVQAVPEPGSAACAAAVLATLGWLAGRRRQRAA